ncbi:hypothetical protein E4G67_04805 [Candidatus Bathyarchaeota archaeon]|nr:MAG: hypothetical protein E4G67_04805 [Candidatus Bathyarchaeota archaeon]
MQQQTLERRLELLKDEGYGYFRKEIVERLSVKYGCAKSTIYHDFATKPVWQPLVMEVKNALLTIVNRHEQLYRKAALTYMQSENNAQKIAAISLLKTINLDAFEMLQSTGQIVKVPEKVEADITKRSVIIHMWKPENARPRNNDTVLPSA